MGSILIEGVGTAGTEAGRRQEGRSLWGANAPGPRAGLGPVGESLLL